MLYLLHQGGEIRQMCTQLSRDSSDTSVKMNTCAHQDEPTRSHQVWVQSLRRRDGEDGDHFGVSVKLFRPVKMFISFCHVFPVVQAYLPLEEFKAPHRKRLYIQSYCCTSLRSLWFIYRLFYRWWHRTVWVRLLFFNLILIHEICIIWTNIHSTRLILNATVITSDKDYNSTHTHTHRCVLSSTDTIVNNVIYTSCFKEIERNDRIALLFHDFFSNFKFTRKLDSSIFSYSFWFGPSHTGGITE